MISEFFTVLWLFWCRFMLRHLWYNTSTKQPLWDPHTFEDVTVSVFSLILDNRNKFLNLDPREYRPTLRPPWGFRFFHCDIQFFQKAAAAGVVTGSLFVTWCSEDNRHLTPDFTEQDVTHLTPDLCRTRSTSLLTWHQIFVGQEVSHHSPDTRFL